MVLAIGEDDTLWERLPGYPMVVSSLGLTEHGNHSELLSMGKREWEHSQQSGNGAQRVIGGNNKRGCCTGRHAAWPVRRESQSLWNYGLGARDRNRIREQRRADMS